MSEDDRSMEQSWPMAMVAMQPVAPAAKVPSAQLMLMKSQLLAAMSHELRTPLHSMIGLTGLLAGTALSEEQATYVRHIKASCDAILALVTDMRQFAKGQPAAVLDDIEKLWFAAKSRSEISSPEHAGGAAPKLLTERASASEVSLRVSQPVLRMR